MLDQTENEPTVHSRCTRCQDVYFMHQLPEDASPPAARTPRSATVTPATTASASDSGVVSTARLQGYLQPSLSPLGAPRALATPLDMDGPSSSSTALRLWTRPGPPPTGSVNDRRMSSAAAVRGVSLSPFHTYPSRITPIPTGSRMGSVRATRSTRSARTQQRDSSSMTTPGLRERKYLVIIHPEPVRPAIF